MNLHEQIGALEMGVDQLIQAVVAPQAAPAAETNTATTEASETHSATVDTTAEAEAKPDAAAVSPTLEVGRPSQNEITMTIGGQTVSLHPQQIGQLIEELSNARASMMPETPQGVPPGWRFVTTKDPAMAVQKQSNGDRLLILRHTGHGWVPFTFSPAMAIQLYTLLTKG